MGAGRKTTTCNLKEKLPASYTINGSCPARNMRRNDLGGVIFGCKHNTMKECLTNQLFGLPASHFSYVKNVGTGFTVFLFNYSDRTLHGIFEAASAGQLNINPHGWTSDGDEATPYAAQVRVNIRQRCLPLAEEKFAPIIASNYYEPKLFWFELDRVQTRKLVDLFMCTPVLVRNPHLRTMAISKNTDTSTSDTSSNVADEYNAPREERRDFKVNVECGLPNACTVGNSCATNTDKSWSSLFKPSSHSDTTEKGDIFEPQSMSQSLTQSDQSMGEIISPAISPSADDDFWDYPWNSANFNEPVNCSATSPSPVEGPQHGSWEVLDDSGNFQESLDSSWRIPSSILTEIGQPSQPPSNSSRKDTQSKTVPNGTPLNTYNDIDTAPLLPISKTDFADTNMIMTAKEYGSNSLDLLTHVAQLVQEINCLKESQLEQNRRIGYLEKGLIESKSVIQLLRNRSVLTHTPSTGSLDEVNFELPQKFPDQVDKSVYMVGGFNGSSWLSDMDSYCVSRDLMRPLNPMTFLRSYSSVTSLNGQLYVLGGARDNVWYDTVEFYSPTTDNWGRLPSLSKKKGSMASASLYGNLYAIGGGNGVDVFSEVEMFDFNTGRWSWTQTMNQKRFSSAAIENEGALYVVGGYDGKDYLRSSARLDPREKNWTKIGTMHTSRGCHSVVALNGKLFALGGYDGFSMVSTVEVLDLRFGSWSVTPPMNVSRGYSGAVVIDSKIYNFGGVDHGGETTDTIECYSEECGWQMSNLKAMGKRCFFSAIVL